MNHLFQQHLKGSKLGRGALLHFGLTSLGHPQLSVDDIIDENDKKSLDIPSLPQFFTSTMAEAEFSEQERIEMGSDIIQGPTARACLEVGLSDIDKLRDFVHRDERSFTTPALDHAKLLMQYRQARKRLFLFDYDGTLTPIVREPQLAIPSDGVIRIIKTLASDPANQVWIISGRDKAFLESWMGNISELGLSAEHGNFMRHPYSKDWVNTTAEMDMSWQQEVMEIFQHFTERTQGKIAPQPTHLIFSYGHLTPYDLEPGSFVERKQSALTWHYRCADPEYGTFQANECHQQLNETVVRKYDIEVMTGKANLEVRPKFVNKGEIVKRLVADYGEGPDDTPEFVLCLGDDLTDEGTPHYIRFYSDLLICVC